MCENTKGGLRANCHPKSPHLEPRNYPKRRNTFQYPLMPCALSILLNLQKALGPILCHALMAGERSDGAAQPEVFGVHGGFARRISLGAYSPHDWHVSLENSPSETFPKAVFESSIFIKASAPGPSSHAFPKSPGC